MSKFILHVDMDAFFAAIEQRDNPNLANKPVVIGADPKGGRGRGVVSTCSYQAREFGIHSAMPISIAYRRCPEAIFLPVDMAKYHQVSETIYEIFYEFTPKVEVIGIDEAFLDITGSCHLFSSPRDLCKELKARIKRKIKLTASVGLAPTMMAAKIASDLEKPDGLVEVKEDKLLEFLWPLDIGKIWGLGKKSKVALNNIGINTIGDLAKTNPKRLEDIFGKNGEYFWQLANGIDQREVETEEGIKSIGNEFTFEHDTADMIKVGAVLLRLSEKVSRRLRNQELKGRTITLKIRLEGFQTFTRAMTLTKATNFTDIIYKAIKKLFSEFVGGKRKIRLVGVKVSNLCPDTVKDTFLDEECDKKRERIHRAVDKITTKFGVRSIRRATGIDRI